MKYNTNVVFKSMEIENTKITINTKHRKQVKAS